MNCPWKAPVETAAGTAPSREVAILARGSDGCISLEQLKEVFGLQLGDNVKRSKGEAGEAPRVYHIVVIEASKVILQPAGEHSGDPAVETTMGDLVDYYTKVEYVEDIVVRGIDLPCIEDDDEIVTDYHKCLVKVILYKAQRLHQPKGSVDLKVKGEGGKHVFASKAYATAELK